MITYLGMTAPISMITWLKNPYEGNKSEVEVKHLKLKDIIPMIILTVIVTFVFYFILDYFNTANLIPSTFSVTTSFLAIYLTTKRSPFYAVAYAADAKVIHSHNYSCMQQFHRNFDLGVSQAEHPEVFEGIKSESEGIKLVKQTAAHLVKRRKIHLVPKLVYQSGCKYIGYRMGKMYKKLPDKVVKWCSMSPGYWEK